MTNTTAATTTTTTAAPSAATILNGAAPAAASSPPPGGSTGAAPPSAPAANGANWLEGADADSLAYAQKKGWEKPTDLLASYRNMEKLISNDKIPKPKGDDDKEGWANLYNALGRPEKPEGYKIPVPEGQADTLAKAAAPVFHEAGLTQKQVDIVTKWWNGQVASMGEADTKARAQQEEVDLQNLRGEWGGQYDQNVEAAKRAKRTFGLDDDAISKIESGYGTAATIKLLAKLGLAIGEDSGTPGEGRQAFGSTKEQAQHEINTLKGDKMFMAAYMDARDPGHKAAVEKMSRLHMVAAG